MLKHLSVTDFVLVRELEIEFHAGLTVITGESGAGKSILMGALGLVLGDRADTSSIRPGAQRSTISAEFDLTQSPQAMEYLEHRELTDPDTPTQCLLRRVVSNRGPSRAFINASPVTLQELRNLAGQLINIHSQDENQILLKRTLQLRLLDDYGVPLSLRRSVAAAYQEWQQALHAIQTLEQRTAAARDRAALLQYHLQELEALNLKDGEYESLDREQRRLASVDDVRQRISHQLARVDAEEGGSIQDIGSLVSVLTDIADDDSRLAAARELLHNALSYIDEAESELRHYLESLTQDPQRLSDLNQRIALAADLARKHRIKPEALAQRQAEMAAELDAMVLDESELSRLRKDCETFHATYLKLATSLSEQRHRIAGDFCRDVTSTMQLLGIEGGCLSIEFQPDEAAQGLESLDFLVVTNPKYPQALLSRVASGGERSRISLAIQVVAARKVALPTLILDEADVGVGGKSSDVVGRLLRELATNTQVLCVTHAPQVAALGHQHLRVRKSADQTSTIEPMDEAARVAELARMLGGQKITEKTRQYAEELIEAAG